MAFRATRWAYLVRFEPDKAKQKILQAFKKTKGNAVKAAELLDVSHRSLTRAVGALSLTDEIDKLRGEQGHPWTSHSRGGAEEKPKAATKPKVKKPASTS